MRSAARPRRRSETGLKVMLKISMKTPLLAASLAVGSCFGGGGEFCDVAKRPLDNWAEDTARAMYRTNKPEVDELLVRNEWGYRHCGWTRP